ncbi:MAG TPA: nuclear transport factor 2 family protein [Ferruginibacter sp.]|nr:nuclear transport factor 2 family protein [Ferruginibacter sp.]
MKHKRLLVILLIMGWSLSLFAQTNEEKLTTTMKEFHQALVSKNTASIDKQTDKALSYGHSNGWIQTKKEVIDDLGNGKIEYHSFKEDSINVSINDKMANVRFVADIDATFRGTHINNLHLKVLEVWVRRNKKWVLFARQAVKG